jgi:hypothetical protein
MIRARFLFIGKHRPKGRGFLSGIRTEAGDYQAKLGMTEVVVTARCPRCRCPLTARQGRIGPYFQCGCPKVARAEG